MTHDPTDIAGQQAKQAEVKERARIAALGELDDYKWLMGSKRGRRIVFRQLEQAGVYRPVFDTNAMTMAFKEGLRNQGLRLTSLILGTCPDLHAQMLKENTDD